MTRFQRMVLRGWASNMELAFRMPGWRRNGFNYSKAEQARLRAIVADRSGAACVVWFVLASVLLLGATVPLIGFIITRVAKDIPLIGLPAVVVCAFTIAPLAMGLASAFTDVLFSAPPFVEAEDDDALYGKLRFQLVTIGGLATLAALALAWWSR